MLKEFKEFAVKGNMVDMAIGIVIGAAFGAVVGSVVNDLLMPLLAALIGTPDFTNLFIVLKSPATEVDMSSAEAIREAGGVVLTWGNFLSLPWFALPLRVSTLPKAAHLLAKLNLPPMASPLITNPLPRLDAFQRNMLQ